MANPVVKHSCHRSTLDSKERPWERLLLSLFLMFFTFLQAVFIFLTHMFDGVCPRWMRWRRTSLQELKDVDHKILKSLPCIHEQKYVALGNDLVVWSVTCNPRAKGTPLVLVHGMGGGVGLWAMNLEALSSHRPVYAFDLLGFGRSSRPRFSFDSRESEDIFVQSIENYRKAMGLHKFILLGHSLGGYLCASYALRYPRHVKHLVMVDPWGISPQPPEGSRRLHPLMRILVSILKMAYPLSFLRAIGPFGPRLVQFYRPSLAKTFASKLGDVSLLHSYIYHCNAQNPSGEMGFKSMSWNFAWARNPMIHRLDGLDPGVPITFVYGARSWVNRSTGWKIKNSREGYVDVQIVRGAGHHVYADRWDLFNTLVETIARSVDQQTLPQLDQSLVKRIHAAPSTQQFQQIPNPEDPDFQRPLGHRDENRASEAQFYLCVPDNPDNDRCSGRSKENSSNSVPQFSLPSPDNVDG